MKFMNTQLIEIEKRQQQFSPEQEAQAFGRVMARVAAEILKKMNK